MDLAAKRPLIVRGFHGLVMLITCIAVGTVVFGLVATAGLFGVASDEVVNGISLALPWFVLAGTATAIWKKLAYRVAVPLLGLSGGWLLYLAWDAGSPPPPPEMPPIASPNSKSYLTYRWLLKSGPDSRVSEFRSAAANELPRFPSKSEEWGGFVAKNRSVFEEAWANDRLGREWIAMMAANAPDGIYPPGSIHQPVLDSLVVRRSFNIQWARAQLQWIDGNENEAAETLILLLRASHHLQQAGATILNQMIATVIVKGTYDRIDLLIASDRLSENARVALAAELRQAPPVAQNIARAFLGEELLARGWMAEAGDEYASAIKGVTSSEKARFTANRVLGPFLYNPNSTMRDHVGSLHELTRLATDRKLSDSPAENAVEASIGRKRLKNPVGQVLTDMAMPAFHVFLSSLWKAEDKRHALLQRLGAEPKPAT